MPFVPDPDVKFDIFVSYAHVDNLEGWVERFHKQLSIKLDQRGGRAGEILIWRDPKLDEATLFDAVIRDRVEHSALFLALCSSGYKRSDYCKGEFDAFRQHYGDARLRVNERSRILRARLQNIPYDELPGTSDRTSAFDFFVSADDDPFGKLLETDSPAFRDKVDRLSTVIWLMLQDLRSAGKTTALPEAKAASSRSVFIAEVADSQRKARERLAADLGSLGVAVAPRTPPPFPAAEHEKAARARLATSKLVVHLIDAWGDNSIEGRDDRTYSQEQFRLAQELKLPQLLWVSPRVPLAQSAPTESLDTGWIGRLNELESATRSEDQYQIVRCPASELPALVAARLPKEPEPEPASADAPAVLLDTHERDHLIAFDVCKTLLTSGIRPDLLAQQDGPGQNSSLFAERLAKTRGLIVLYGRASEEWVRARLDEGRKLMVSNPGGGLRFCGVLLAPPSVAKPESFEHPLFKTTVLDIRQGLSPAALGPVLQGLGVH